MTSATRSVRVLRNILEPFWLVHFACLAVFFTEVSWSAVAVCLALFWLRMFSVTAGYHRYFSHRSYKTSRAFQFENGSCCQLMKCSPPETLCE